MNKNFDMGDSDRYHGFVSAQYWVNVDMVKAVIVVKMTAFDTYFSNVFELNGVNS